MNAEQEIAKLAVMMQSLTKGIEVTRLQIAANDRKWGTFTEGLAYPAMTNILARELGLDTFMLRPKRRKNGDTCEYDVMGFANGRTNKVAIVEVKSHLRDDAIEQLEEQIDAFAHFYPEHAGKAVYGVIAAVEVPEQVAKKVIAKGFYLARIHDEKFELAVPRGFKPTAFHPKAD